MSLSSCDNCGGSNPPSAVRCAYCGTWFKESQKPYPPPLESVKSYEREVQNLINVIHSGTPGSVVTEILYVIGGVASGFSLMYLFGALKFFGL